jgi:hypothetical protein
VLSDMMDEHVRYLLCTWRQAWLYFRDTHLLKLASYLPATIEDVATLSSPGLNQIAFSHARAPR